MAINGIPIYLNRSLINDLSSLVIDGYIESKSQRCGDDMQGFFKKDEGVRCQDTKELKLTNGDKDKSEARNNYLFDGNDRRNITEARAFNRREYTTKTIYTNFVVMNTLMDYMLKNNELINLENDMKYNNICCDKYINCSGCINGESILTKINHIIDVLECYDTKELDTLIDKDKNRMFNYTIMNKQLKCLSTCLSKSGTQDLIVKCSDVNMVVTVNTNYFWDKNAYVYDMIDNNCRFYGRVTKVLKENESICLLRKTCMDKYYKDLLESYKPYLKLLKDNGIMCCDEFVTEIQYPAIQITPIVIYV